MSPDPRTSDAAETRERRPRARRRFEQRRREVVDASIRLFSEKGYDAASLLDIAEAVGLLKGSLYYYAQSKEDLLFAIVEEVFDEGVAAAAELRNSDLEPVDALQRSLERAATYMLTHREQAAIYFRDAKALSEERQALLRPRRTEYVKSLADVLRAGQREGQFRSDLDARVAAIAIIGAINWLAIQDPSDAPTPAARSRFVNRYCAHLLRSVVADHEVD
jgi:AcrR family transcriptional regulator